MNERILRLFLCDYIHQDGKLDLDDVRFLVELLCDANEVSPEFESLCETALQAHATSWDVGGS